MWKNIVERGRQQMTIWRMRIACWVPKATNSHTHIVWYSLIIHNNNGCMNAPQCYVIRTLPVSFLSPKVKLALDSVSATLPTSNMQWPRYWKGFYWGSSSAFSTAGINFLIVVCIWGVTVMKVRNENLQILLLLLHRAFRWFNYFHTPTYELVYILSKH
jgi:hypothetical protein